MDDVSKLAIEELEATGINFADIDMRTSAVVTVIGHALDAALAPLDDHPQGLRSVAAVLRAYSRIADQYAVALDAQGQP